MFTVSAVEHRVSSARHHGDRHQSTPRSIFIPVKFNVTLAPDVGRSSSRAGRATTYLQLTWQVGKRPEAILSIDTTGQHEAIRFISGISSGPDKSYS